VELAGEDVHAEVAVLASLRGDVDADDLARTALEDQEITNANEVAGDGDGAWRDASTRADYADFLTDATADLAGTVLIGCNAEIVLAGAFMLQGVKETVGSALNAAAEGVVVAVVVVVTHLARRSLNNGFPVGNEVDRGLERAGRGSRVYFVRVGARPDGLDGLVGAVVRHVVDGAAVSGLYLGDGAVVSYVVNVAMAVVVLGSVVGVGAASILAFGDVDLALNGRS
jgi:hypothetical protein